MSDAIRSQLGEGCRVRPARVSPQSYSRGTPNRQQGLQHDHVEGALERIHAKLVGHRPQYTPVH
jgi:hypothetical protein